jgi:membrane fusion protein (multidrug efflux system)
MAETKGIERQTPEARGTEQPEKSNGQSDGQAPGQPQEQAANGNGEKKPRPVLWVVGGILVVLALFFGIRFWLFNRSHVSTDDAYVTGNLVNVSPLISGTLMTLNVEEGQFVHKGDLIAKLDPSGPQSSLRQAQANYQAALAQIPQAERNLVYQQLETNADIQKAQAGLVGQQAKASGARQQVALTTATVKQQVAQARSSVLSASAQAAQADAQVSSAIAARQSSVQGVTTARATLANYQQQLQAQIQAAQAAEARVTAAQAQANQATRDQARYQTLYSEDAISAQAYDAAVTQAQNATAQLQAAQAERDQANAVVGSARASVAQAQSQVAQSQRAVAQSTAQVNAARQAAQAAHEQVGVAQAGLGLAQANATQIPIQESNLLSSTQQTSQSQADVETAKAGQEQVAVRQNQVTSAKASAAQARAALTNAEITLNDTNIYAPCDGEIVRKDSNQGATMSPGSTIVTIAQKNSTEDIWVDANFKETQLQDVRPGEPAEIEVDAIGGTVFKGVVESVMEATGAATALLPPDNATGNFTKVVQRIPVRIRLVPAQPGDDKKYARADQILNLRQGMSVTATIDVENPDQYSQNSGYSSGPSGSIPPQGAPGSPQSPVTQTPDQPAQAGGQIGAINGESGPNGPASANSSSPGFSGQRQFQSQGANQSGQPLANPGSNVGPPPSGGQPQPGSPMNGQGSGQSQGQQTAPTGQTPAPVPGATGSTAGNAAGSPAQAPSGVGQAGGVSGSTAGGSGH